MVILSLFAFVSIGTIKCALKKEQNELKRIKAEMRWKIYGNYPMQEKINLKQEKANLEKEKDSLQEARKSLTKERKDLKQLKIDTKNKLIAQITSNEVIKST